MAAAGPPAHPGGTGAPPADATPRHRSRVPGPGERPAPGVARAAARPGPAARGDRARGGRGLSRPAADRPAPGLVRRGRRRRPRLRQRLPFLPQRRGAPACRGTLPRAAPGTPRKKTPGTAHCGAPGKAVHPDRTEAAPRPGCGLGPVLRGRKASGRCGSAAQKALPRRPGTRPAHHRPGGRSARGGQEGGNGNGGGGAGPYGPAPPPPSSRHVTSRHVTDAGPLSAPAGSRSAPAARRGGGSRTIRVPAAWPTPARCPSAGPRWSRRTGSRPARRAP